MPFGPLQLLPGVNTQMTPTLAGEASMFSQSQLIRFKDRMLQKYGGWQHIIVVPFTGTVRALIPFEDLDSNIYIGAGDEQRLYVYTNGMLYDVTPVIQSDELTTPFSTTATSRIITVTDAGYQPRVGDWLNIVNTIAVGGLILQGLYTVTNVVDPTNYQITAPNAATGTVINGGTAVIFNTSTSSPNVTVTLPNNGLAINDPFTVFITTNVGGFVLLGQYAVTGVTDADNFIITPGGNASFTDTRAENGGNVDVNYLIPSGTSTTVSGYGVYGTGVYGEGAYGLGSSPSPIYLRYWSLDAWGIDMVASYNSGPLYFWDVTQGLVNNPAFIVPTAPHKINAGIFIAMPEQQVVALGASVGATDITDQLLVRWSDVSDYTAWTASAINQAGSFRIPRGSHIVGGLQGPQQGMIWTDLGLWLMQYIQPPLIFGFTEIGQGCGLYAPKAAGVLGGIVYWMSQFGFFRFDGNSVQPLPCTVWDKIFKNINSAQSLKVICAPNSSFNEIAWFYPSSSSDEVDSYVKFNALDNVWDYGTLERTAWIDQSIFGPPIGVDGNKLMQQHETGNDADGIAMDCFAQSGYMKIAEGNYYTFVERLIPDFVFSGGNTILLTLSFLDYPQDYAPYIVGPLSYTQAIQYLIVRGRGRLVSIKIESKDLGSFWRHGETLYLASPSGKV